MSNRIGISMRAAAALAAAVVLLPLLVFVDPAPSSAHEQTEERCDYDPLTQQEYNCRQVEVSHVHPPNHYSPPPDTSPRPTTPPTTEPPSCPAGQHSNGGAGRNCHAHSFTPPCGTGTWSPGHGHTPIQRPPCPAPEPPSCPAGQHSNGGAGRNCHAHSFTPPCGTGTWSPGHGHTPIQRPPCPTTPPPTTTTTPDEDSDHDGDEGDDDDGSDDNDGGCLSGTFVSGNCQPRGGDDEAGEESEDDDSACPTLLGTHPHLDREQHRHLLLSGTMSECHDDSPGHQHTDGTTHTDSPDDDQDDDDDGSDGGSDTDTTPPVECPQGYTWTGSTCELDTGLKIVQRGAELVLESTGQVLCTAAVGGAAVKALNLLVKGGSKVAKWALGIYVEGYIEHPCDILWDRYQEHIRNTVFDPENVDPENENENGQDESDSPEQSSSDDETTTQTVEPVQTPDTTTQTEPAEEGSADQQGGGDSSDANGETASSTTSTTPPAAVGSVTRLAGAADGTVVWLGWDAPASGPTPTAYRVLRAAAGGTEQEIARVRGNAYRDRHVQSGVTYTYRIQAMSGAFVGPVSAPASVAIP